MDHFDCSEDAEFANCQSHISLGYSSSIPLQVTDENMNILSSKQLRAFPSGWSSFEEGLGVDGTAAPSSFKSHSEAEKRRRDRINGQLHTLRKLIPKSEKMDKAALLASVIDNVKDLKSKATEVSKPFTVPSDVDEVRISTYVPQEDTSQADIFIEATMCCEDRPELLAELRKALQNQKLLIIRAKMACLGCRVQIELLLSSDNDDGSNTQTGEGMISLKRTLRAALNRVANSTQSVTSYRVASKRQRYTEVLAEHVDIQLSKLAKVVIAIYGSIVNSTNTGEAFPKYKDKHPVSQSMTKRKHEWMSNNYWIFTQQLD